MIEKIRKWCIGSFLRYKICLLINILFIVVVMFPLSCMRALKEQLYELIVEIKDLWSKDTYNWIKKEIQGGKK